MIDLTIKVRVYPGGRVVEYEVRRGKVTVFRLLKDLGYKPYTAVIVRRGTPLTEDELVFDGDEVELYEVRSAG